MSLTRATRRSGLALVLLALLGAGFFCLMDPRFGADAGASRAAWYGWRHWVFLLRGSPGNLVDAANESSVATVIGISGCALTALVGLWLMTRRTI